MSTWPTIRSYLTRHPSKSRWIKPAAIAHSNEGGSTASSRTSPGWTMRSTERWRPRRRRRSTHPSDASPNSANRSLIWVAMAGTLALVGGPRGRRAALAGLTSIVLSSATVNVALKGLYPRERPDRATAGVVHARQTKMPESASFPSGHSASGFAFATAVGHQVPMLSFPLGILASAVAYSRVHSGVHYPGDAIVGSLTGAVVGLMVSTRFSSKDDVASSCEV